MEQQQQIKQLETELASLEINGSVPVREAVPAAATDGVSHRLKELFARASTEAPARESKPPHPFDEIWNGTHHVCPECWHRQPIEQDRECELCGTETASEAWMRADIATLPPGAHLSEWDPILNKRWKVWAASLANVDELQEIVAKWSGPSWKIKHAARILRLRGAKVPLTFHGEVAETMV